MVALLGIMWGTAVAQAIVPAIVFWPLFIITQLVIWSCVAIGCVRLVIGLLARIEDGFCGNRNRSNTSFFPDPKWEQYKNRYLR